MAKVGGRSVNRQLVFLGLAVVFAGAAAFISVHVISNEQKLATVVVAQKDIPAYQPITADEIATKQVPAVSVPPNTISDPNQLLGHMLDTEVFTNYMFPQSALVQNQQGAGALAAQLTAQNQPTYRAYVVPATDLTAVGGTTQLKAGDHVDAIFSGKLNLNPTAGSTATQQVEVAKTILSNVEILSIVVGNDTSTGGKAQSVSGLTLYVSEQDAELLDFAQSYGTLSFALDPYNAQSTTTPGVSTNSFLSSEGFNLSGK